MLCFWAIQPGLFFTGLPLSGIVFYLRVGMFGVGAGTLFGTPHRVVYEPLRASVSSKVCGSVL